MRNRICIIAGLLLVAVGPLPAQMPVVDARIGGHFAKPTGDFANTHDGGYGIYGRIGVPLGSLKLMAGATLNRFTGIGDLDVFTLQAGPHLFLVPMVDIGLEGAYISEIEEFGLSASVSVGLSRFELHSSYTTTMANATTNWLTVGIGIRF